ncbi:hypothetical protein BGW80DRAFT_638302 [Lactifluus volemus]|nr:hypothetical protein BGW80DRAFT_638302 [Lactifluus volemus]
MQRESPQLKILDPLFRVGTSRPQRMHNGLPLSLLDFLLVTAMLLVTPTDEWMNVTRTHPSEPLLDAGKASSTTSLNDSRSSDPGPSYGSHPSETPNAEPPSHSSETTPAIERWRASITSRHRDINQSPDGDDIDDRSSTTASRTTSRLSCHTDIQSTTQHVPSLSLRDGHYAYSTSSLSLLSRVHSSPQPVRRRTRELPVPPLPSSQGHPYGHGPLSAMSHVSHVSYLTHSQPSPDTLTSIPSIPTSSSISPQHSLRPLVIDPNAVPSRRVITSGIHSRSLPTPPTPSTSKPRSTLPLIPSRSAVASVPSTPLPTPIPPVPHHRLLSRSRSYSHLQNASVYPDSPHEYEFPVKAPPNYDASAPDPPPLSLCAHVSTQRVAVGRSLSICTTNVAPAPSAASASTSSTATSLASEEGDPFDMPPAYSALDMARSPLRLHAVNGDVGDG